MAAGREWNYSSQLRSHSNSSHKFNFVVAVAVVIVIVVVAFNAGFLFLPSLCTLHAKFKQKLKKEEK